MKRGLAKIWATMRRALTLLVAIAAGGYHSLGLKANGSIVAWGNNIIGECNIPAPNTGFVAVAAVVDRRRRFMTVPRGRAAAPLSKSSLGSRSHKQPYHARSGLQFMWRMWRRPL